MLSVGQYTLKEKSRCNPRCAMQYLTNICVYVRFFLKLKYDIISHRHPQSATVTLGTHKICAVIAKPSTWRAPHHPPTLFLSVSLSLSIHPIRASDGVIVVRLVVWPCRSGGHGSGGSRVWRGGGARRVIGWERLLSSDPTPLGTTLLPIVSISHSGFFLCLWGSF